MKTPEHLNTDGKALFEGITAEYDFSDDEASLSVLITACEALDLMAAAKTEIATHGAMVRDRYGLMKVNPACSLLKDSRNGFLAAMKSLNLESEGKRSVGRPPQAPGWKPKIA